MKTFLLILIFFTLYFTPTPVFAQEKPQFITIVNPVRISSYTQDIGENIKTQYLVLQSNELPATWLITYDVLTNEDAMEVISDLDDSQEIGVFFEITPNFTKVAGVQYNETGFWHHATSIFLSGYLQEERIKMIDALFIKFKDAFGYFPSSVGAWWIDSFSLDYMQRQYGITANLGLADQFSTDGYKVWGQYWSTPFYPSKYHAGIPASDESGKLDLVTLQWAPRDPYNGYFHSYYSTQDYLQNPVVQDTSYFKELVSFYAEKKDNLFGQAVVGLESDLSPDAYLGEFKNQIEVVKELSDSGNFQAVTLSEFSSWYRNTFPDLSPVHIIEKDDLLGKPIKVIWYQSPNYRIGLTYNSETKETKIFDFRTYHNNFQEPYYLSPNKEFDLSIYIPSLFDEIDNFENVWDLELGGLMGTNRVGDGLLLNFEKGNIKFQKAYFEVNTKNLLVPSVLTKSPVIRNSVTVRSYRIDIENGWVVGREGYTFRDLTDVATHELARKKTVLILLLITASFSFLTYLIIHSKLTLYFKLGFFILMMAALFFYFYSWYQRNSQNYYVSQAEIDALVHLASLPKGRVAVVDKECLGCEWHTEIKPAVFSNKRSYVQKWGKHPIIYNLSVFEAKNQEEARREFQKLNAKYIYLSKYEDYIEKPPFSPGDLNIEKIYDNANAEIWRVKE